MPPKAVGRHTPTQQERERKGLKWKSASTLDRQRARRKNKRKRAAASPGQEPVAKARTGPAPKAVPPPPPAGPRTGGTRGAREPVAFSGTESSDAEVVEQEPETGTAYEGEGASPTGLRPHRFTRPPAVSRTERASAARRPATFPGSESAEADVEQAPDTGTTSEGERASPTGLRPFRSTATSSVRAPQGLLQAALSRAEEEAVEASMSSEEAIEPRLSGTDISNRPALPYTVGLKGVHEGASPPGDVVSAFFPQTLELVCNLVTQESQEPEQLQRLQAGKSRAVYDFVPARSYVLKLSMENGHGREVEAASSLPGIAPATEAYDRILMRLYWRRENTEYLLLTEVLKQARVTPLNQAWPGVIPESVVLQAGAIIAFAAKQWQVKDLGSYNLALLDASSGGHKLCILDMADWIPWGQRYPVFPGKQKARGLLTFVRHGHSESLLKLFESFAGQDPSEVLAVLRQRLKGQALRALVEQGVFD